MGCQKSAEGIVGPLNRVEGPNVNLRNRSLNFDDAGEPESPC